MSADGRIAEADARHGAGNLRGRVAEAERDIERRRIACDAAVARERVLPPRCSAGSATCSRWFARCCRGAWSRARPRWRWRGISQGRFDAIACYQTGPRSSFADGVELADIVRDQLHAVGIGEHPRAWLAGPAAVLRNRAVALMTLAIHELTTSAIKFGALSGDGRLAITWSVAQDAAAAAVRLVRGRDHGRARGSATARVRSAVHHGRPAVRAGCGNPV